MQINQFTGKKEKEKGIVDSVLELPFIHDEVKNILYKYAVKDQEGLLSLLAQYDYPNIKKDIISSFCEQLICWIESLTPQSIEEDFALELLRQGTKTSRRINHLLFLEDNTDKLLIENFVPIYTMRAATFPNSNIHFDKCGIVESNIQTYIDEEDGSVKRRIVSEGNCTIKSAVFPS